MFYYSNDAAIGDVSDGEDGISEASLDSSRQISPGGRSSRTRTSSDSSEKMDKDKTKGGFF